METADQTAADVFATALEGGVNYWSLATEIAWAETKEVTYLSVKLHEYEEDDEKIDAEDCIEQRTIYGSNYYQTEGHTVTLADVKAAIRKIAFAKDDEIAYLAKSTRKVCRDLLFEPEDADYDSSDADEIIQVAMFGEVKYG